MQFSTIALPMIAILATFAAAAPAASARPVDVAAADVATPALTNPDSVAPEPYYDGEDGGDEDFSIDGPAPQSGEVDTENENDKREIQARGFGCPWQYECHNHCKSIKGRNGGYCGGWFKLTCICYK